MASFLASFLQIFPTVLNNQNHKKYIFQIFQPTLKNCHATKKFMKSNPLFDYFTMFLPYFRNPQWFESKVQVDSTFPRHVVIARCHLSSIHIVPCITLVWPFAVRTLRHYNDPLFKPYVTRSWCEDLSKTLGLFWH